jgi:hypothetical protein
MTPGFSLMGHSRTLAQPRVRLAVDRPDSIPALVGIIRQMDDPISRAAAARARAARAAEAAASARARAQKTHSRETVAEAEERRLLAEERLAAARAELTKALERSRNAHLDAAQLDAERGDDEGAARHRAGAEDDRRTQDDLAS